MYMTKVEYIIVLTIFTIICVSPFIIGELLIKYLC